MKEILTREFAIKRKNQIGKVKYDLLLEFKSKAEKYYGKCTIRFNLRGKEEVVFESTSNIKKILVNGKERGYEKEEVFVKVKEGLNEDGENVIEVEYESNYDHSGDGLHQFIDLEDGTEYIYSNFEPYEAHRMFPCFDQPDLKATLKMTVRCPKEWVLISNENGTGEIFGEEKVVHFNETKKLSTYLFHLSAGNYAFLEDFYDGKSIRIYSRESMKKYVPHEEIFKLTKQGLDFYSKFFEFPMPFDKYDQIFVPEFNSGAMENPGAITFSEKHLTRRKLTRTEKAELANTILHEMAHMWFGDLVTMKWWDDLWLNESFADFMSYFAMNKSTEFKESWRYFYARKSWAYYQDQLITTHPIATSAGDTDVAFSNFDGISYAKGASVLKQLMFYIGEESFRRGLADYFKKYQWENTELRDFLGCLEKSSGKNLKKWFDSWIKTTGVNSTFPQIKFSGGKIRSLELIQKPPKDSDFSREHKTKIALFYGKENPSVKVVKDLEYSKDKTYLGLDIDEEGFAFLETNHEDWDYVKNFFDENSLGYIFSNISKIESSLTKDMIYGSIWQMLRDAEIDPKKVLNMMYDDIHTERDLHSLERLFIRINAIMAYYVSDKVYEEYCKKFFDLAWERLKSERLPENKDLWFRLLIFSSPMVEKNKVEKLVRILEEKEIFEDFYLDQDRRWSIIVKLNSLGHERALEFLEKEKELDKSDRGMKEAVVAEVSSIRNKQKFWEMFLSGEGKSLDYLREAMGGFHRRHQKKHLKGYAKLFFKNIRDVSKKHEKPYVKSFFANLFPSFYVEEEVLDMAKRYLEEFKDEGMLLNKYMSESIDDLERALKIIKKYF